MDVLVVDDSAVMRKITTEATFGKPENALQAGVDEYVTKPFTPEMLARKVRNVFARPAATK